MMRYAAQRSTPMPISSRKSLRRVEGSLMRRVSFTAIGKSTPVHVYWRTVVCVNHVTIKKLRNTILVKLKLWELDSI